MSDQPKYTRKSPRSSLPYLLILLSLLEAGVAFKVRAIGRLGDGMHNADITLCIVSHYARPQTRPHTLTTRRKLGSLLGGCSSSGLGVDSTASHLPR